MVNYEVKLYPERSIASFPTKLCKIVGRKATAIPNEYTILLYRSGIRLQDVLASVQIIEQILALKVKGDKAGRAKQNE